MNPLKEWHNQTIAAKTVAALRKNNFQAAYYKTGPEAVEAILKLIPADATVGVGGSATVGELGLPEALAGRGNTVFNHNQPGLSPEQKLAMRHSQLTCDVFLTSANAITSDGRLVNTDGTGNRVAAMIFGPKLVIVVAGINKIAGDLAAAERRVQTQAAPLNNKRLNLPNPCVKTGECMDCQGPTRICNVTTVMHRRPSLTEMQVIIVGEDLGY
jgi:hypothetical protein